MNWISIIWEWGVPGGNVEHVAEHDLMPEEVDHVLRNPHRHDTSHASGLPALFGWVPDRRYIIVIYDEIDSDTVMPFTAYEVEEPGR